MSNSRKMSSWSVGASLGLPQPHLLTPGGWYLKFYFVDPDTVFINVHRWSPMNFYYKGHHSRAMCSLCKAMRSTTFRDMRLKFNAQNMPAPPIKTAEQFAATVRSDVILWQGLAKGVNLKAE